MRIDREKGTTGDENHAESPEHVQSNHREPGAKLRDRFFSDGLFVEALPACGALSAYGISNFAFGGRGCALVVPEHMWLQNVVFHVHAVASFAAGFADWRLAGSLTGTLLGSTTTA